MSAAREPLECRIFIHDDLNCKPPLRMHEQEVGHISARFDLTLAGSFPNRLHFSGKHLTGIDVQRNFNRLAGLYKFQVLLIEGCKKIGICIRNKGRDGCDPEAARQQVRAAPAG
jgi:hypothetical protein